MKFSLLSGVRNDLLQEISDQTDAIEALLTTANARIIGSPDFANQIPIDFTWQGTLGPSADTVMRSYTVPANRVARVSGISLGMVRNGSASASGDASHRITITPSGGAEIILARVYALSVSGVVDVETILSCDYYLTAGDMLRSNRVDLSTGGTYAYRCSVSVVEFDA